MNKFAKRVDENQAELVKQLRSAGFKVYHTYTIGKGFPDILVNSGMMNHLIEIKKDDKESLTEPEKYFIKDFHVIVGYSLEQILKEILIYEYFLSKCLRIKYENKIKKGNDE